MILPQIDLTSVNYVLTVGPNSLKWFIDGYPVYEDFSRNWAEVFTSENATIVVGENALLVQNNTRTFRLRAYNWELTDREVARERAGLSAEELSDTPRVMPTNSLSYLQSCAIVDVVEPTTTTTIAPTTTVPPTTTTKCTRKSKGKGKYGKH